jgi:uncharacterized protein (DUF2062 family)
MRRRWRRFVQLLFHVNDSPRRTALAFGIGVFIAFFPVIGLHTALALAIAFLFRLNRVALLLGAYINNPWTLGPLFSLGTLIGCTLTGVSPQEIWRIDWSCAERSIYIDLLRQFIWPFIVGNLILGILASILSYGFVHRLLVHGETRREIVPVVNNPVTTDPS